MTRKIAKSGLKGRKKDTFLLFFLVTLAFVFISSAVLLHSSSEKTKTNQRLEMFGKWQASLLNVDYDIYEEINLDASSKDSDINKIAVARHIGQDENFGHVMAVNDEMLELGNINLLEGNFPSSKDDIVLEFNQLSYFKSDIGVGDTINVSMEKTLFEIDEMDAVVILNEGYLKAGGLGGDFYREEYERDKEAYDFFLNGNYEYYSSFFPHIEDEELKHELMINKIIKDIYFSPDFNKRNINELEEFDGTKVITRTSYIYYSSNNEVSILDDAFEWVNENAVMLSQKVIISRPMKVSGIIDTYSDLWDKGDYYLANSFVTEEAGEAFLENAFYKSEYQDLVIDIEEYEAPLNLFVESNLETGDFLQAYSGKYPDLRRNFYAYPELSTTTEATLTYGVITFVFIATVLAVFQIYLTQMRRRTRKLALLKSIGATNSQVVQMILWEGLYLLLLSLPTGVFLSFLLTKGLIAIMNQNELTNILFDVNYRLFGLGLIAGIAAVAIGMLIPIIFATKIPLTGKISKVPKHKKSTLKIKNKIKQKDLYKLKKQSFLTISLRNMTFNKGKFSITVILYTFGITVLLSTLFLSYLFFQDYINQVIMVDRPNYGFEAIYALPKREFEEVIEEIEAVQGVTKIQAYRAGEHAFMWYEGIKDQELHTVFKELLTTNLVRDHFGQYDDFENIDDDDKYLIEDSLVTNVYGIDQNNTDPGSLFDELESNITMGSINKENFAQGKEVVVLMPIYKINDKLINSINSNIEKVTQQTIIGNSNYKNRMKNYASYTDAYDLTYDFRYKDMYYKDTSLKPGDTIHLAIATEEHNETYMLNEVARHEVKVGAVIHYFEEIGMWPFAETIENPVIIGSNNLIGDLYPTTVYGLGRYLYNYDLDYLVNSLYPTKFGKTYIYVNTENEINELKAYVDLQRIAFQRGFTFINYLENKNAIFIKAFNFTSIIAVLGFVIVGIIFIVLYNTTISKVEQERDRIGILQSLGVSAKQFNLLYLITGFFSALIALLIAHIILLIIIYLTMDYRLWLYPWKLHIAICIGFVMLATLVSFMPIRKILKNQPVNNIRSLTR